MRGLLLFLLPVVGSPIVGAVIWLFWVVHAFNLQPPMGPDMAAAANMAFKASNLLQLDDLYGKDKAITLRSCFRNLLFLNIPHTDPATAEELSKGVGESEFVRKETQRSRGYSMKNNSRTISHRNVTEKVLLPSQIQDLPNLKAYVSFAGDYPLCKVSLAAHLFPKVGVPFEPREDPQQV